MSSLAAVALLLIINVLAVRTRAVRMRVARAGPKYRTVANLSCDGMLDRVRRAADLRVSACERITGIARGSLSNTLSAP